MEVEVKGIVYEMKAGKITGIQVDNNVFFLSTKAPSKIPSYNNKLKVDKGKVLGSANGNCIYEHPFNDVKISVDKHQDSNTFIIPILRIYYPTYKQSSLKGMASLYRRTAKGLKTIKTKRRRRHRHKPDGAVGFNKTYNRWIMKDNVQAVKLAINTFEYGFRPTVKAIINKTKLNQQEVVSTLKWMKDEKQVSAKRESDKQVVYRMV